MNDVLISVISVAVLDKTLWGRMGGGTGGYRGYMYPPPFLEGGTRGKSGENDIPKYTFKTQVRLPLGLLIKRTQMKTKEKH